jgi:hypothetical protein
MGKREEIVEVYIKILNNCYYYQDIEETIIKGSDAALIEIEDLILSLSSMYNLNYYYFILISLFDNSLDIYY